MAIEIERKFLVSGSEWRREAGAGKPYLQGYICTDEERTVRVRRSSDSCYLTVKGPMVGFSRTEYEYPIPLQDADEMLRNVCTQPIIEKTRYQISHDGLFWEIDEFGGRNRGLTVAEVELESENQVITLPSWIGEEVTEDPRYLNANLVQHPFDEW